MDKKKAALAAAIIVAVLVLDQTVKFMVKTSMVLGEDIEIASWFHIHFVENNGMAFGMELGGNWGKMLLTLIRLAAIGWIGWFLVRLCKPDTGASRTLITTTALVWAGAMGNIFDSVFYGVIFDSSWGQTATLFPPDGGYSSLMRGRVVDMLYFPLIEGRFPDWFPFWGGEEFLFFRPVFNIADSSICIGIAALLLFAREELNTHFVTATDNDAEDNAADGANNA